MKLNESQLKEIHKNSMFNKHFINNKKCGCFYCESIFEGSIITEYTDSNRTALCPNCNLDSVIYEKDNLEITQDLLNQMNARWFKTNFSDADFDFLSIEQFNQIKG